MWYTNFLLILASIAGGTYLGNKYLKLSPALMNVLNTVITVGTTVWGMKALGLS